MGRVPNVANLPFFKVTPAGLEPAIPGSVADALAVGPRGQAMKLLGRSTAEECGLERQRRWPAGLSQAPLAPEARITPLDQAASDSSRPQNLAAHARRQLGAGADSRAAREDLEQVTTGY